MVETQIEKNLKMSFSYVKRDLIKVNEQVNDIYNKIQHLNMNHIGLLDAINKIEQDLALIKGGKKPKATKAKKAKSTKTTKTSKKAKKPTKKIVKKETITYE